MYDRYDHGSPKMILSVGRVMGPYLHMTQVQSRVTYVAMLLCLMSMLLRMLT